VFPAPCTREFARSIASEINSLFNRAVLLAVLCLKCCPVSQSDKGLSWMERILSIKATNLIMEQGSICCVCGFGICLFQ